MVAAAIDWIHDTSMDQQYVDRWNKASKPERAALLKDAGRDPYLKHRSWEVLDSDVRVDVVTIINRQAKKNLESEQSSKTESSLRKPTHHTIAANDPRLWWNKD